MAWTKESREKALASKRKTGIYNQFSSGKTKNHSQETKNKISSRSKQFRHTEETKKIIKEKALSSKHRRLKRKMIEYKGILLDSSWELLLAKRLDELKIEWIRPEAIQYIGNDGIKHNYFPDFYLPKYDLYLDPKNSYAYKIQEEKINILKNTLTNLVILTTLDEVVNFMVP